MWIGRTHGCVVQPHGITLSGEIDDDFVNGFEQSLRHVEKRSPPNTPLPVYISSMGGDVYAALKMVDLIDASPMRIMTVAVGPCMSAAALLFACGCRRYAGPNASFMLHSVRCDIIEGKLHDVAVEHAEMLRLNGHMFELMSRRTGNEPGYFNARFGEGNTDSYVTPTQAREIGLATHIGVPTLTAHVSCTIDLDVATAATTEEPVEPVQRVLRRRREP